MLPGYLRRLVRCVPYARRNNMDYHSPRAALLIGATLSFVLVARSQPACFFSEPFNGPALPTGWIASPDSVAQQSSIGDPLGTNTIAWRIGTAESASSNGYFPVPDLPLGNTFAMVNDDAQPCNCDMDMVTLTSPPIALAFHLNTMVEFRAYNDGRPQHGEAWLDASSDGVSWSPLERIPEVLALWQTVRADLGAYDGGQVYLRFRWSDAHAWASGFAIDDVCVFDRVANDLSLLAAYISDPTLNVLDETGRSLEYLQLPLEQQQPLVLAVHVLNRGTDTAVNVLAHVDISLNGGAPDAQYPLLAQALPPGADTLVILNTGWTANVAGSVSVAFSVFANATDEANGDNDVTRTYLVTDIGVGNNAMAIDNDLAEAPIEDGGNSFSTGCRFELKGGSSAIHGIGVRLFGGTEVGASIHTLVLSDQLNLLSSSGPHSVTQEDLDLSFAGGTVYVPLDSSVDVTDDMDVIALVRADADSGAVVIASGGVVAEGAGWKISASNLDISFPLRAPIVRLYLSDPVTGIASQEVRNGTGELRLIPNPAQTSTLLNWSGPVDGVPLIDVFDATGRSVHPDVRMGADRNSASIDLRGWPAGCYMVRVLTERSMRATRLIVVE